MSWLKGILNKAQTKSPYIFYLPETQSPTYYNLCRHLQEQGWQPGLSSSDAHFSELHFQFNELAAQCLEFKNSLAQLIKRHCPEVMLLTYCINDNNWTLVLNQIAADFYVHENKVMDECPHLAWILKPALLNNGQHIKIFTRLSQLEAHYLSNNRLGGEHVVQHYLMHPHLLKGPQEGHKYSIRMFVVLTNYAGAYLYPQGYFNVGLKPYKSDDFTDLRPHLTNEHLQEDELNVVQVQTRQYDLFKPFYPEIKAIVSKVIDGLKQEHSEAFIKGEQPALAIFGFDFIVDQEMKVWLLEANHAPCFPIDPDHPLQNNLYHEFWQDFISDFVDPIAGRNYRARVSFFDSL